MATGCRVTIDEFIERLMSLRRWSARGERAPHKPLLVLLVLGRLQRDQPRLVSYLEVEDTLRRLLEDFGPPRKSHHPEFPFWHLQSDGIWEVEGAEALRMRAGSWSPTASSMRQPDIRGGPTEEVDSLLRHSEHAVARAAEALLGAYFPPSIHEDLLAAVGLNVSFRPMRRTRDPEFRLEVLRAYDYTCAVCGYEGWLDTTPVGLDAAHVRWFAYDGNDALDNALCLCALHHRALDRGVLSIDLDRRVMVTRLFRGHGEAHRLITALAGRPIAIPQPGLDSPTDDVLHWHHREVFRGEPRSVPIAAEDGAEY